MPNMPEWKERGAIFSATTSSNNVSVDSQLFSAELDSGGYLLERLILSGNTDTDDPFLCRFVIIPEMLGAANIDNDNPPDHSRMIWADFYIVRGPITYDIRSKRKLNPGDRLFIMHWKLLGGASSTIYLMPQVLVRQL